MVHEEAGRHWESNAEAWTRLARAGYDVYRDGFNTPAFFETLPGIEGLSGLDAGCGEGHNTRLVAGRAHGGGGHLLRLRPLRGRDGERTSARHPLRGS